MSVLLNPYLAFENTARQAMEFYQSVFGGELTVMTFSDLPGMDVPAGQENNVMHSQLMTDNGFTLMAGDMGQPGSSNGSISLSGDDETTLRGYWEKLSEGGQVGEPLAQAPWGDTFGMCTDKFGVNWMINIAGQQQG